MKERLHKVLAAAGVASRRRAEELIARGEVRINGQVAHIGDAADPTHDEITVMGSPLASQVGREYIALNKPPGYVSSLRSTHGEHTVVELVSVPGRIFPVGRLDKETSGLLLLTNDGDWANILTHPRYRIEKEYRVLVRGHPAETALQPLREGVILPDGEQTAPARVIRVGVRGSNTLLSVTVEQGKKRQIRLMARAVGHPVISLQRTRVGPIHLDDLPSGSWRRLRREEVEQIRELGRAGIAASRSSA